MHLYKLHPKTNFISVVADFITEKFVDDLSLLRVMLPTNYACLQLQQILIERNGAMILPNIGRFKQISNLTNNIVGSNAEHIETISYLENKVVLAEIINSYQDLNFDLAQSLRLSPMLADLFYKFALNNLSINDLALKSAHSSAEHWQNIYKFLLHANNELKQKINKLKKIEQADCFKNILSSEISRLQACANNKLLIAGVCGDDQTSWQFLSLAVSNGAYLIAPPLPKVNNKVINANLKAEEDGLYCLKQLLRHLNCKFVDFQELGLNDESVYNYDQLITNIQQKNAINIQNLDYCIFENIFDEAKYIAQICKKLIDEKPTIKIAIILNNKNLKNFYCSYLNNYNIKQCDLLGEQLAVSNIYQFIQCISEMICNDFEFGRLLQILKNPGAISAEIFKLEKFLRKKKHIINNWQQLSLVVKNFEDKELINWLANINSFMDIELSSKFGDILKQVLTIAERLAPGLWQYEEAKKIAEIFRELIRLNWSKTLASKNEFPTILKELIAEACFIKEYVPSASVTIGTHQELAMLKFEQIILADFSEGNWPRFANKSPWLNRKIQIDLGFYDQQISTSASLYNFYLLLFNAQVLITRSKKQSSNAESAESSYLLKLKFITDQFLQKNKATQKSQIQNNLDQYITEKQHFGEINARMVIASNNDIKLAEDIAFPERISATDIEMLIRGPYSFYAKKILNLRVLENLNAGPTLADFGNFVHSVIDKYAKNYCRKKNKLACLLEVCDEYLQNNFISKDIASNWSVKFRQIAAEFIIFDEERREKNSIYSEIYGEMVLNVLSRPIKIVAIADRLEIDQQGKATILDFKTGSIPTQKDVMHGLSPQLIIEAIMMREGSFGLKNIKSIPEIAYVKIASSKPYLKLIKIKLKTEDLDQHLAGIIKLLEHYLTDKNFNKNLDLLKYNNYKHLSRSL